MTTIPKIIHQIWIGPKPCPTNLLRTWKEKHPDFEYILWTESELERRCVPLRCREQINAIPEINGKADIIRWELLYLYGGYFVDADSICIEPFDHVFEEKTAFASYENENNRKGLVATGTMGFVPKHPLCGDIIEWILSPDSAKLIMETRAWYSVGPALLTKMLDTGKYCDFTVFPSYYFLPQHFTGLLYTGHKKVYAYQEWGTANESYDKMNMVVLPECFREPSRWVSVLIASYNTKPEFIKECMDSILRQEGHFGIEIVWVNDGSNKENSIELEKILLKCSEGSRFIKIKYINKRENKGHANALNSGLLKCSHSLIFKMDADDIMMPSRISRQMDFMDRNPEVMICGTNMTLFKTNDGRKEVITKTNHPEHLTWEQFKREPIDWFMNHPTLCYRKEAVMKGYTKDPFILENIHEDYELEVRIMRTYGSVYNLSDSLLFYRIHPSQITSKKALTREENDRVKSYILDSEFFSGNSSRMADSK